MRLWSFVPEVTKTTMQVTLTFMITVLIKTQGQYISDWRCADSNTTGLQLLQSNENILGRYNLQICTTKPIRECDISIIYLKKNLDVGVCDKRPIGNTLLHSFLKCQANLTCEDDKSVICFSHPIDLIINGCYKIEIRSYNNIGYHNKKFITYVQNNLTQQLLENNLDAVYVTQGINILWRSSLIPITSFTAKLCNLTDSSKICTFITNNCAKQQNKVYVVECLVPLSTGNYVVYFTHDEAPWTEGDLLSTDAFMVQHYFNVSSVKPDEEIKEISYLWIYVVFLVTIVAICVCICGSICIRYCKIKQKSYPKRVLDLEESLVVNSQSDTMCIILLMYSSKDTIEGQALAKLFADNGANIVDIQSVVATKTAGKAPSLWATKMIQSDNIKIVWLQTKRTTQDDFSMPPIQTFGDTLVQHFLWRMTDTVQQPKPYTKYFLAAFPGAVEFPNHSYIVRFTRFIINDSVKNLLLYTGTISDVNNVNGIDQFYKSIQ